MLALVVCVVVALLCSQAQSSIVINEIMYNHAASEMFEFVELYNRDAANAVSLSGWRFLIGVPRHHAFRACVCMRMRPVLFLTRGFSLGFQRHRDRHHVRFQRIRRCQRLCRVGARSIRLSAAVLSAVGQSAVGSVVQFA
jgi:hypothetical protein